MAKKKKKKSAAPRRQHSADAKPMTVVQTVSVNVDSAMTGGNEADRALSNLKKPSRRLV